MDACQMDAAVPLDVPVRYVHKAAPRPSGFVLKDYCITNTVHFYSILLKRKSNHKKIPLNDGLMIQTAESIYTLHPAACKYGFTRAIFDHKMDNKTQQQQKNSQRCEDAEQEHVDNF